MVLQWHSLKHVVITQNPNPDVRLTLSSALKPQLSSPFQGSASALRCAKGSNAAPVWRESLCTATKEPGLWPPAVYSLGRVGQGHFHLPCNSRSAPTVTWRHHPSAPGLSRASGGRGAALSYSCSGDQALGHPASGCSSAETGVRH